MSEASATTATIDAPIPPTQRLPWPYTAAALVALFALYWSGKGFLGALVLAALLLLASFVPLRLPSNRVLGWVLRIVMWVIIISVSPDRHAKGMAVLFEPDYIHLFGCLCGGELVLRAWTRWPRTSGGGGPARGEVLLLTALIITAASNTYERAHMQILVPVYALLTILCLRDFARRGDSASSKPSRRTPLIALRVIVAGVALALGCTSVWAVTRYERKLTSWATDLLRDRKPRRSDIGFSTTSRLHAVFNPAASMNRALLIEGSRAPRHLRTLAYDVYESRRWKPPLNERAFAGLKSSDASNVRGSIEHLRFTRLIETADLVSVPLETARIECPDPVEIDALGDLRNHDEGANAQYELDVVAHPDYQAPLCKPMDDAQRQRALTISVDIDPRVVELARQVAGDRDLAARVFAIQQHLRGKHGYSLSYDPGEGEPLNDFILNRRAAHCQYFASAMVVMARAAGVPARYVAGYYAHEVAGDGLVVRERDAHAWAECWIDGAGWVTVDATPAAGRPDQLFQQPSTWRQIREWVEDLPRRVRGWFATSAIRTVALVAPVVALMLLIAWSIRLLHLRGRKRRQVARAYSPPSPDLLVASNRFERILRSRGILCAADRTWREHVRAIAEPIKLDRARCLDFLDAYDAARFGGANGAVLPRLRELLDGLERHDDNR